MSRPAWLGPQPTGARAAVIMLRAHLTVALAYAELGLPAPASTMAAVHDYAEQLASLLALELGIQQ
jgi:hypothetical protein